MQQRAFLGNGGSGALIACLALGGIVLAQWLLSGAIHGTNYFGVDGKMAQASAIVMRSFGSPFEITSLGMVQGLGSQMLPKNAWANPALWPFGWLGKGATDLSALIAFACFSASCFGMARLFGVALVPSVLSAQLCIVLFAPLLFIFLPPTNFALTPADAVVYALYMIALGVLARVRDASPGRLAASALALTALVTCSIYCDPLWAMVAGFGFAVPFAVVTLAPLERRSVLARAGVLACCLAFLVASGVAEYLYTLSQYTARVQFAIQYAKKGAKARAEMYNLRWPDEPELDRFLEANVARAIGRPFGGAVNFFTTDSDTGDTLADLWSRGIPTANEYSQLVTPQALYFVHAFLKRDVRTLLNRFDLYWADGEYTDAYWKMLAMMGVRYVADRRPLPARFDPGLVLHKFPYRPRLSGDVSGYWHLYEVPRPNLGDYSPTEIVPAARAAEVMARIAAPGFDFARQVVLPRSLDRRLVPAREARLMTIRGGLHVSAKSDGTSLLLLPQQFSSCLKSSAGGVEMFPANLLMTALVFSKEIDTDIRFGYGLFEPGCRRTDLQEMKRLEMRIELRAPHLSSAGVLSDWNGTFVRLHAAWAAIK